MQINVTNPEVIEKLMNDQNFRKSFLADTKKLLDDVGYTVDERTLTSAIEKQVGGVKALGGVKAASTFAIITIF
ncbi:hypothetical protein FHX15_003726 [Rhizobium sp. BK650]|uniref:hypothetical protein n=1 Tax=Rhizobium sp. BK650 TaxID=2586990 RepID=UPI0016112B1A|nr:hypothetical protein [Rhizobium sp. BK650]MBB3658479.1 hypothetical protein [Rhizobium sp. BK650]